MSICRSISNDFPLQVTREDSSAGKHNDCPIGRTGIFFDPILESLPRAGACRQRIDVIFGRSDTDPQAWMRAHCITLRTHLVGRGGGASQFCRGSYSATNDGRYGSNARPSRYPPLSAVLALLFTAAHHFFSLPPMLAVRSSLDYIWERDRASRISYSSTHTIQEQRIRQN
jgi:hypothetical protein